MDFFKKSCKELCSKLIDESIGSKKELDSFVEKKCEEFKNKNNKTTVLKDEKKILNPLYEAFSFKNNNYNHIKFELVSKSINISYEDTILMKQYVKYLNVMENALKTLAKPMNVKFFSIFLGIGTGRYYREAAKKLRKRIDNYNKICSKLNNISQPGIFKGLPNGGNYCYLNTALQELYGLKKFSSRVMESNPPKTKEYEILAATKFFFEYLSNKISEEEFENNRKENARILGYDGNPKASAAAKREIETNCRNQMRKLKNKDSLEPSDINPKELNPKETAVLSKNWGNFKSGKTDEKFADFINSAQIIEELYKEKDFRDKVLSVDESELTLKDYKKLEMVVKLFNLKKQKGAKFYSKESHDIILKLGSEQTYQGIKKEILDKINQFYRSKKAKVLSVDSTIDISVPQADVKKSLEDFFNRKSKENMAYYLPLKNKRFSVQFSDRGSDSPPRESFSAEETVDLSGLVKNKKLKIFVKNQELKRKQYQFKLISASIGTGSHYYMYEKSGSGWKIKNDSSVENRKWENIQKDINTMCETLTYELIS